jgi:hypothetical protein
MLADSSKKGRTTGTRLRTPGVKSAQYAFPSAFACPNYLLYKILRLSTLVFPSSAGSTRSSCSASTCQKYFAQATWSPKSNLLGQKVSQDYSDESFIRSSFHLFAANQSSSAGKVWESYRYVYLSCYQDMLFSTTMKCKTLQPLGYVCSTTMDRFLLADNENNR